MKSIKYVVFVLLFSCLSYANNYDTVVNSFLQYQSCSKQIKSVETIQKENTAVGYVYSLTDGGYVIVAVSKELSPVLSYSFKSDFINLPTPYKEFLINQLYITKSSKVLAKQLNTTALSSRWSFLEQYVQTDEKVLKKYIPNTNLLTTTWNQNYPYNKYFPKVNNELTLAGCVQVAMAQVMKYHAYPLKGKGVAVSTQAQNGVEDLKSVFNRYYNWDNMPDNITAIKSYQEDEIAFLMRDMAVLNKADLGVDETGATANTNGLVENFGYSNTISSIENISADGSSNYQEFVAILKSQVDNELPVLFSIPGHMVVADGYRDDSTGNWVHLNMGWGGVDNTFYNLDNYIYTSGAAYPSVYSMIYNIKPCSESNGDCYKNLETNDNDAVENSGVFNIQGVFDNISDNDIYELYLNGTTTFSGTRGYSNQAFYINVYDINGTEIGSFGDTNSINLNAGLCKVEISMCSTSGYCYDDTDPNYSQYTVNIDSNSLTQTQINDIEQSIQKPPVIDQQFDIKLINGEEKILVNGYDENSEDNISFDVQVNNTNVNGMFTNNILTLVPNVTSGHSKVKVILSAGTDEVNKEFDLFVTDEKIYYGKEFSISSVFDDQYELESHSMILEGACTISGMQDGYDGQYFYTSLLNNSGSALSMIGIGDITTSSSTVLDRYTIQASLKNYDTGYYYSYDPSHSSYTLSVLCPNTQNSLTQLSDKLTISLDESSFDTANDTPLTNIDENTTVKDQLVLQNGWNLLSANIELSDLATVKTAWQYENGTWSAYSPDIQISTLIQNSQSVEILEYIKNNNGTWIETIEDNISIDIVSNSMDTNTTFDDQWTLAGSANDINVSDIECLNGKELISIWKYSQGWLLHTSLNADHNYTTFDTIKANDGFWVNCE